MAQAIEIHLWCDPCLEADEHTTGETITVPALFGQPAFEVEACEQHAKTLRDAVDELRAFGRKPEGAPRTRTDQDSDPHVCPRCGDPRASLAALRAHLRDAHDLSLADVGLARRVHKCSECPADAGWFEMGQGFASHRRLTHPKADPDGRAVAQRMQAA